MRDFQSTAGGKNMALIDLVRIQIDDSRAVEVGETITDFLGWTAESGLTRRQYLHKWVKDYLVLTYQRGKKKEALDAFTPPADPDLQTGA